MIGYLKNLKRPDGDPSDALRLLVPKPTPAAVLAAKKYLLATVMKANPYHDGKGRFTTKEGVTLDLDAEQYSAGEKRWSGTYDLPGTTVRARDADGRTLGVVDFNHSKPGVLVAENVWVHENHRRKGIAMAMYAHAEKVTGRTVQASPEQTDEGKAFWSRVKKFW
jgi:hypothetical protein